MLKVAVFSMESHVFFSSSLPPIPKCVIFMNVARTFVGQVVVLISRTLVVLVVAPAARDTCSCSSRDIAPGCRHF